MINESELDIFCLKMLYMESGKTFSALSLNLLSHVSALPEVAL